MMNNEGEFVKQTIGIVKEIKIIPTLCVYVCLVSVKIINVNVFLEFRVQSFMLFEGNSVFLSGNYQLLVKAHAKFNESLCSVGFLLMVSMKIEYLGINPP